MSSASLLKSLADKVVTQLLQALGVNRPPQLQIISLGALTYRDVWDGTVVNGATALDDFLRLRIWAIQYLTDVRGKQVSLLTLVANGYPANVGPDVSKNMSIFEPYWLG